MTFTTLSFLSLLAVSVAAVPTSPGTLHSRSREVTSSSKTGLAWPNGDADAINQYYQGNKVSWYAASWSSKFIV
jgi:hypothetical protein